MEYIGQKILAKVHERGLTVAAFAEAVGVQRPNAYRIFNAQSIDTEMLFQISQILHYDFFRDYSERLK